jgi:hypothetical protein
MTHYQKLHSLTLKLMALFFCIYLVSCNSTTEPGGNNSTDEGPSASATWDTHFTYSGDTTNVTKGLAGPVSKLLVYNSKLYGFGYFHYANSSKHTYSCAFVWNGTTYDSLPVGLAPIDIYYGIDYIRYALPYAGKILVSGVYDLNNENRLSTYDGTNWVTGTTSASFSTDAVSTGNDIYDYYIHKGAGFPNDSSEIYKYDGTKFNMIGGFSTKGFTNENVTALGTDANTLYVATEETGGIVFDAKAWVYKYNGSTFTELKPVGNPLQGSITKLIWVKDTLYGLGDIQLYKGYCGVVKWDGTDWITMDDVTFGASSSNPVVDAVADKNGNIYVATTKSVYKFNGTTATKLGTVTGGSINTLMIMGNKLFLGGNFSAVDGIPSVYFAVLH